MLFNQRYGYKPVKTTLQIEEMDEYLRLDLWNYHFAFLFDESYNAYNYVTNIANFNILKNIWCSFLHKDLDKMSRWANDYIVIIKKYFLNEKWSDVYSLIEFISLDTYKKKDEYTYYINSTLEKNLSGYRLIGDCIIQITSADELHAIEESIEQSKSNGYTNVNEHLSKAVEHFSRRGNPDYRNSIKESISAVEAVCRQITEKSTLGGALDKVGNHIEINPQLREAFMKLYAYTNSEEGIRHALMDGDSNTSFDEAKYMLVSCSAFVSYLISKTASK